MRIKVMNKKWKEVLYAVNFTDSGYVLCVDYTGGFIEYPRQDLQVIDPEYLPNKDESAKTSDFLPEDFFKNLGKPAMSGQSWE